MSIKKTLYYKLKIGLLLNKTIYPIIRYFKSPKILWGHINNNGEFLINTRISDTVYFSNKKNIIIGDNVFISHYCFLDGTDTLEIGEGSQICAWVGIYTHSSHISIRLLGKDYTNFNEVEKIGFIKNKVSIGKYVYIGANAQILPGVSIGDGALISAGSIVKKNVPAFAIIRGAPARIVGDTRELDSNFISESEVARKLYNEWTKH